MVSMFKYLLNISASIKVTCRDDKKDNAFSDFRNWNCNPHLLLENRTLKYYIYQILNNLYLQDFKNKWFYLENN